MKTRPKTKSHRVLLLCVASLFGVGLLFHSRALGECGFGCHLFSDGCSDVTTYVHYSKIATSGLAKRSAHVYMGGDNNLHYGGNAQIREQILNCTECQCSCNTTNSGGQMPCADGHNLDDDLVEESNSIQVRPVHCEYVVGGGDGGGDGDGG